MTSSRRPPCAAKNNNQKCKVFSVLPVKKQISYTTRAQQVSRVWYSVVPCCYPPQWIQSYALYEQKKNNNAWKWRWQVSGERQNGNSCHQLVEIFNLNLKHGSDVRSTKSEDDTQISYIYKKLNKTKCSMTDFQKVEHKLDF